MAVQILFLREGNLWIKKSRKSSVMILLVVTKSDNMHAFGDLS